MKSKYSQRQKKIYNDMAQVMITENDTVELENMNLIN